MYHLDNLSYGGKNSAGNVWKSYSAYTSGYQSVDHLSDIDEFEENFKVRFNLITSSSNYFENFLHMGNIQ